MSVSSTASATDRTRTASRRSTRRLVVDGISLAVTEAGSEAPDAPVVVLVHGLGHWTDAAWARIVPRLDPARRIVAFDLPGFGESDRPDAAYDLAFFRRMLAGVLDGLGIRRAALVGHSLGALICADLAAAEPDRVTHLALLAPAGYAALPKVLVRCLAGRFATWIFTRRPSPRFVRRMLTDAAADPAAIDEPVIAAAIAYSRDPLLRRAFARVYAGAMQALLDVRATHRRLARWTGPTLIIWGEADRYTSIRALPNARRVYPGARVEVFPETGHVVMVERPAEIAALLDAFLAEPPRRAGDDRFGNRDDEEAAR